MKVKGVIFDKDGVLIDTEPIIAVTIREAIEHFGGKGYFSFEDKMNQAGKSAQDTFQSILEKTHLKATFDEYREFQRERYYHYLDQTPPLPNPGVIDFLLSLQKKGIKTAIGTGSSRQTSDKSLSYSNLSSYFDAIVTSDDVKRGKPAPDTFLLAAKLIGLDPENCVVLGDSLNDHHAAKSAGMRFIHVTVDGYKGGDGYSPDLIIQSVKDLTIDMLEGL